jgi:ATP-dependent Clp protease ATP-binding subunit ClpX
VAALIQVLTEPKNALVRQYQQLFEYEGVKLTFTEDALIEIAQKAIARETGARGLRSILEHILRKTMFDLPSQKEVLECVVDVDAVKGVAPVTLIKKLSEELREQAG